MTADDNDWLPPANKPKKRRRLFLWFFLAVQALFILWLVTGLANASGTPDDCGSLSAETCNDAESIGTGIGVFLIFVFWAIIDFILGVGYAIYLLAKRR